MAPHALLEAPLAAATKTKPEFTLITKEDIERARSSFTFPDSGITVRIERIAPATKQAIAKALEAEYPKPKPPMQEVDYGDGPRMEANTADPGYLEAIKIQEEQFAIALVERMFVLVKRRIEVEVDPAAVKRIRDDMEAISTPLNGSDKDIYVDHVCISSEEDAQALMKYLMRRSQPTEEAVQEHIDTFRGDVQG